MSIPYSLYSCKTESLIDEESLKLKSARKSIAKRFRVDGNEIIKTDLDCVAMPEILSAQYCTLLGNEYLLKISPPLQAFLSYAVSIYDVVSDNHLYNKKGEPTFLKIYGLENILEAEESYKKIIFRLSKELGREIPNAPEIVQEMYDETIRADKLRNSQIVSSREALLLQERLAGEHAYKIAVLSKAKELAPFSSCLVNAITTLEDLADLFRGEDFTGKKTTIPISFLAEEFGNVIRDYQIIKRSLAIRRTKEYVTDKINSSKKMLIGYDPKKRILLTKILEDLENFNKNFPEGYL